MRGEGCKQLANRWFYALAKTEQAIPSWRKNIRIRKFQPVLITLNTVNFKRETAERVIDLYSWHNRIILAFTRIDGTIASRKDIEEILREIEQASAVPTFLGIAIVTTRIIEKLAIPHSFRVDKESKREIEDALFHGKIVVAVSPEEDPQDIKVFTSQLHRELNGKKLSLPEFG